MFFRMIFHEERREFCSQPFQNCCMHNDEDVHVGDGQLASWQMTGSHYHPPMIPIQAPGKLKMTTSSPFGLLSRNINSKSISGHVLPSSKRS